MTILTTREGVAAALIILGGAFLTYEAGALSGTWFGLISMTGATLCWALDNNLAQRVSLRDPIQVMRVKTLSHRGFS